MVTKTAKPPENLTARFKKLVSAWKSERDRYSSDPADWAMCLSYQKIIGMGSDAIPLILGELKAAPDHWFWALHVITDEDPVAKSHRGQFKLMVQDWLSWGESRGFLLSKVSKPVSKSNPRKLPTNKPRG